MADNSNSGFLRGDNSEIVAKTIGIPTMLFLIFSFCCGGAFGVEDMICSGGPGLAVILLAVLPFLWALPQAMTAAELGSAIPYTGGFYKWNQAALGEFWGFTAGMGRVIAQYLEMPGYILLAAGYIEALIPMSSVTAYLIKAGIIILFTLINLRGIKEVGWIATVRNGFIWSPSIFFSSDLPPDLISDSATPDETSALNAWASSSFASSSCRSKNSSAAPTALCFDSTQQALS